MSRYNRKYLTYIDSKVGELTLAFRTDGALNKYLASNNIDQKNVIQISSTKPNEEVQTALIKSTLSYLEGVLLREEDVSMSAAVSIF